MISRFFMPQRPRLFGHRGSPVTLPENTLPSFQAAIAAGMRYIELDVRSTRDGQLVVHHDATALRTCGRDRKLCALTLAECRRLDAGYGFSPDNGWSFPFRGQGIQIPTLAEVLALLPDVFVVIEVKDGEMASAEALLAVIQETGSAERVLLAAVEDRVLGRLRALRPQIPTGMGRQEIIAFYGWVDAGAPAGYRPPGQALQIPVAFQGRRLVTAEAVRAAHEAALEMHVWTVNDPREMEELLQLGVDGIMSDDPGLLREVAHRWRRREEDCEVNRK